MPLPIDPGTARDVAEVLVATGRAVPPHGWVEKFVRRAEAAELAMLPHNSP